MQYHDLDSLAGTWSREETAVEIIRYSHFGRAGGAAGSGDDHGASAKVATQVAAEMTEL